MIDLILSLILLAGAATGILVQSNLAIKSASNLKNIQTINFQIKDIADLNCDLITLPAHQEAYKCITSNANKPQTFYVFT